MKTTMTINGKDVPIQRKEGETLFELMIRMAKEEEEKIGKSPSISIITTLEN